MYKKILVLTFAISIITLYLVTSYKLIEFIVGYSNKSNSSNLKIFVIFINYLSIPNIKCWKKIFINYLFI